MSERKEFDHSEDKARIRLPSLLLAKTRTISLSLSLWDYQATDEERTIHKKAKIQDKIITRKDRVQECDHNSSNDHDQNNAGIDFASVVPAKKRPSTLSLSLSLWDHQATDEERPTLKKIKIKENTTKREDQVQEYDQNNCNDDHDHHQDRNNGTIPSVFVPANRRPLSLSLSLWDYQATDEERPTHKKIKIQEEILKREDQVQEYDQNNPNAHDQEDRNNGTVPSVVVPMNMNRRPPQLLNLIQQLMPPSELKSKIDKMGGRAIKMVIQKQLFRSDVASSNSRFSIPENQIEKEAKHFLTQQEVELFESREANYRPAGMRVMVIDPELEEYNDLILKKWEMKVSSVYNLTHQWNAIVQNNNLKVDDIVQLWSFRSPSNQLCFALVKL